MAKSKKVVKPEDVTLTDQEWRFIEAHAVGNLSVRAAMKHAGYAYTTADQTKLLAKPHIQAAIAECHKVNADRLKITREKVYTGLMDAIDQAKIMADPTAQIAGWREVAKIAGFYDAPVDETKKMTDMQRAAMTRFKEMSDEDILVMLAKPVQSGQTIDQTE